MMDFMNFIKPKILPKMAYEMGKDCAVNGPNTENCNFTIFSSPENTKAWEDGKRDYEKQNA